MSVSGPNKKDIRSLVQPMLDAIAPDCATNLLELAANREARQASPAVAPLKPMGWQNNFFETKLRQALDIDVLKDLNCVWGAEVPLAKQVSDIVEFVSNVANPPASDLTQTVNALLENAPEYIDELHVNVKAQFDDTFQLDCDPFKALVAFHRMVHTVLCYNAKGLLDQFNEKDTALLNQLLTQSDKPLTKLQFKEALDDHIAQLITFSTRDRIRFRLTKAVNVSFTTSEFKNEDHSKYFFGQRFDTTRQNVNSGILALQTYPSSLWQGLGALARMSKSIAISSLLFPVVKLQQAGRYLNQVLGLPLRALQASTQDIPVVGSTASAISAYLTPYAASLGLGVIQMYQLFLTDKQSQDLILSTLSPFARYLFLGALGLTGGFALLQGGKSAKAAAGAIVRNHTLGQDFVDAIVQENMVDFKAWLTPETVAQLGLSIFEEPIVLPEEAIAILSQEQQNQIYSQIAQQRWQHSSPFFPQYTKPQIFVLPNSLDQHVAKTLYLPSRQPRAPGMEDLCDAILNLKLAARHEPPLPPRFDH